jgi:hypothetical protein
MKQLLALVVAGMFSVSAASYACDAHNKNAKADSHGKTVKIVKKDSKKDSKKS